MTVNQLFWRKMTSYVMKTTDHVIAIDFTSRICIMKLNKDKWLAVNAMIAWLSNYLVRVLLKNEIIEADKIEIYQYGYEIMISTIITFLIVLISGIILNCLPAALLYFGIFVVMRQICGGYHAQHYWSCNTLFAVVIELIVNIFNEGGQSIMT